MGRIMCFAMNCCREQGSQARLQNLIRYGPGSSAEEVQHQSETYKQFCVVWLKEWEINRKLVTRLLDLAHKWMKERGSINNMVEVIMKGLLLDNASQSLCLGSGA